jgi:hypothetical protein
MSQQAKGLLLVDVRTDLVSHMIDPIGPVGALGAAGQTDGRRDIQGHGAVKPRKPCRLGKGCATADRL